MQQNFFEDHDITIIDKEENRTDEFNKLDISFCKRKCLRYFGFKKRRYSKRRHLYCLHCNLMKQIL